jgi:hypothetical protein
VAHQRQFTGLAFAFFGAGLALVGDCPAEKTDATNLTKPVSRRSLPVF